MSAFDVLYDILSILGALAFFLFGMKLMSESLQKIAGVKMRQYLSAVTSNKWKGLIAGFLVTGILQSSSAATVLLVGFVNAGLISLLDSVGLIFGANIGTTVTSWLIMFFGYSFNIRAIVLPLIALSIPLYFTSNSRRKSIAEFIMGFSILFIGLQFLRDILPDVQQETQLVHFLSTGQHHGFLALVATAAIGIAITIIIQSSTATIALTIVLLSEGLIGFEVAAALVIGENIGTTATANIAAIVANRNAKRTALIHSLFNLIGALLVIPFFHYFVHLVEQLSNFLLQASSSNQLLEAPMRISLFHSLFNIINALLLIGFTKYLVQLSVKILPIKSDEDDHHVLTFTDNFMTPVSELSVIHTSREINNMAKIAKKMFLSVPALLLEKNPDQYSILSNDMKVCEAEVDEIERQVMNYLTKLTENKLSASSSRLVNAHMIIVNNLESIADVCYKIARVIDIKNSQKAWFNQEQRDNLNAMFSLVEEALEIMGKNLVQPKNIRHEEAVLLEKQINALRNQLVDQHFHDMKAAKYPFNSGNFYQQIVVYCEKIGDHVINVSETLERSL